jgi:hypothetical protein
VQQHHIWLMHPPDSDRKIHHGVWRIVCLAAINAMHVGLKAANKHHQQQCMLQSQTPAPAATVLAGQRRITPQWFTTAVLTEAQEQHQQAVQLRRQQRQLQQEQQRQ